MQRRVTLDEATAHLVDLVREVAAGGSVVVEEGGRPLARMVPAGEPGNDEEAIAARAERYARFQRLLDAQPLQLAGPWKREDLYD